MLSKNIYLAIAKESFISKEFIARLNFGCQSYAIGYLQLRTPGIYLYKGYDIAWILDGIGLNIEAFIIR
ncbi:hypothetical protein HAX54_002097, partial [Datura stramonium]|nr:hypothetical protein [Datura stramonium]